MPIRFWPSNAPKDKIKSMVAQLGISPDNIWYDDVVMEVIIAYLEVDGSESLKLLVGKNRAIDFLRKIYKGPKMLSLDELLEKQKQFEIDDD